MPWHQNVAAPRPRFVLAVGLTLWLGGLLVALVLGMGSAYVVVSGIVLSTRIRARFRESRDALLRGAVGREPPGA